jgi:uncharacterized protein (TIGR03437 family)
VFYGNQRQVESDFIIRPNADPSEIRIAFEGAQSLQLDSGGDLLISAGAGSLRFAKPRIYQERGGTREEIAGGYVLIDSRTVGFALADYDPRRELIIDPVVYATLLGGPGSDGAWSLAVDSQGNAYVVGDAGGPTFPVSTSTGAVAGASDAFVAKLSPTGSQLLYSVILGGSLIDQGFGIAVDIAGNAYVTGRTASTDFPTTVAALHRNFRGGSHDAFMIKLDSAGSLVYSTYVGGAGLDGGWAIAVDAAGNAYTAGHTSSAPNTGGFLTAEFGSGITASGFVAKLNAAGSRLVYSVLLRSGTPYAIDLDEFGSAYVAGYTTGPGYPTTPGAFVTSPRGGGDWFITKLNPEGTDLSYSTLFGAGGYDWANGIAVDSAGSAYVSGMTDFEFGRVVRFNAAGSNVVYSTELGEIYSDFNDASSASLVLMPSGEVRVSSLSLSSTAEVARLDPGGSLLSTTSVAGVDGNYWPPAIRRDCQGDVYIAGSTGMPGFLTTAGAVQRIAGGSSDAFVLRLHEEDVVPGACTVSSATMNPAAPAAPESIASLFGQNLALSVQSAAKPLASLAGVTVRVRDSQGVDRQALLYYASPAQMNYVIPAGTAAGPARVTVTSGGAAVASTAIEVAPVAPGIFTANYSGYGVPAALVVRARLGAAQTIGYAFSCASNSCLPVPIDLGGPEDQVVLALFGTGIRGRTSSSVVSATVGGEQAPVLYAGPQSEFEGLDQVNLLLPRTLIGRGDVDVNLWVEGRLANAVSVRIQ